MCTIYACTYVCSKQIKIPVPSSCPACLDYFAADVPGREGNYYIPDLAMCTSTYVDSTNCKTAYLSETGRINCSLESVYLYVRRFY